jgi:hypothetical protein
MKTKITLALCFITVFCMSQTKVIAHKSHSGSAKTFSKIYQRGELSNNPSNFGLPGTLKIVILDTIIALNKSVTLVKTRKSMVCQRLDKKASDLKKSDFYTQIDTFVNHKIFNKKNKIAYIKAYLKDEKTINFSNPIESIVFIGFKK